MTRKAKLGLLVAGAACLVVVAAVGMIVLAGTGSAYARAEYQVQNLTCGSCVQKIGGALKAIPGVGNVDVSVATGRATVELDLSRTDAERVRKAIVAAGFPAVHERTIGAGEDAAGRETSVRLEGRYVGRIGGRLIGRAEFEEEVARLQKSVPGNHARIEASRLRRMVWDNLVQRQLWLDDAERSKVLVTEEEVLGELDRLRTTNPQAILARSGAGESLARQLKEQMIIERHLEQNVLKGAADAERQLRLDRRWKEISAAAAVEIFDPGLKTGGGCGGSCCG